MDSQSINYHFENYKLLTAERLLLRDGEIVALKPKVFDTLLVLVKNRGRLMTKDEMMRTIWSESFVEEGNLTQYIFNLRQIFSESPQEHRFIVTVPGQGYRFVADVTETPRRDGRTGDHRLGSDNIKSLAVLPLDLLMVSEPHRYLGLAFADTLITSLGTNNDIAVRPTASIIKYVGKDTEPFTVARDLEVDAIIHGTILEIGGRLRVNIQLTDLKAKNTVWSDKFEGEAADVFSFQDKIVNQVAAVLAIKFKSSRQNIRSPKNPEVYQTYLKARFFWESRTEAGLIKALQGATEVVTMEPEFPLGYIGVADSYLLLGEYLFLFPHESFPKSKAAAEKALELAPALSEGYATLAECSFYYEHDWVRADELYRNAIALDPNYASAYHWYAWFLIAMKRYDEALKQIERAQALDPNSLILSTIRGLPFYYKRDYAASINQFRNMLEVDQTFSHVRFYLGSALFHAGEHNAAIAELEKMMTLEPLQQTVGLLGHCYGAAGRTADAKKMLTELDRRAAAGAYISPYVRAIILAGLADTDQALSMLEKAVEENSAWLVWINVEPFFDSLRTEPRFEAIIRKLGFLN